MSRSFLIRAAEKADAAALALLAARTFPLACPPGVPAADIVGHVDQELSAAKFTEHLAEPGTELHVAESAADLIGYTMLVQTAAGAPPLPGRRPMELRRIYVDPQWHGAGVAAALMADAVRRSAALDFDCIWLGTNQGNERAIAFYRKQGFDVMGTRTFQVGCSVQCDYVLARPVQPVQ